MNRHPFLRPILTVTVLALFLGIILGVVNNLTKHQIELNLNFETQKSILYTFDFDVDNKTKEEIFSIYNDNILENRLRGIHYYTYINNGVVGYSFPFTVKGLWGRISGYIAVDESATKLLGLVFVEHDETPGLGARIDDLWFKEQFRNLDITGSKEHVYFGPDGLDTISGATITVSSIARVLNSSINELKAIIEEDLNE